MNTMKPTINQLPRLMVVIILLFVPFHALIAVWGASLGGSYDYLRIWDEILLCLATALVIIFGATHKKAWRQLVQDKRLLVLAGAYILWHVVLGVWVLWHNNVTPSAFAYSLLVNLRFVVFFILIWLLALQWSWLRQRWYVLVMAPAALVVGFGLLQATVLPADILRHVGYGPDTILPFQAVDQKDEYARVQSTLRGPNPLGAYLVIIGSICLAAGIRLFKNVHVRYIAGGALLAATIVLANTYSRSAYIGTVVAAVLICWWSVRSARRRRALLVFGAAVLIVAASSAWLLRTNDYVENVLFHTDEHSLSATSSNESRSAALQQGAEEVLHEPFGRGPGSAGPASVYNDNSVRIAENYYLQIGQEVGWLGIGLFVALQYSVVRRLWPTRRTILGMSVLASLAGITVIAMLSHPWTDDTLAYVWWGLAGVALARTNKTPQVDKR